MAGCDATKRDQCWAQGLVCKKSRCVKSAADKKKKGGRRPVQSPTDSQTVDAVMAVAPRRVAMSLASKGYSKSAGAGMETLVKDTKRQYKRMRKLEDRPTKKTTTKQAAKEKAVMKAFVRGPKVSAKCTDPCTATRTGTPRVREHTSCKCLAAGGSALRKLGVCTPRADKKGKMYETVFSRGRCLKAGGAAAKASLQGSAACPVGKVLKRYTTQVPLVDPYTGRVLEMRTVDATRCVKAVGDLKDCPKGKVLVSVPSRGTTPGGVGWRKDVARCMLRRTAMKKGYSFIAGGLRVPGYTPAQSIGM